MRDHSYARNRVPRSPPPYTYPNFQTDIKTTHQTSGQGKLCTPRGQERALNQTQRPSQSNRIFPELLNRTKVRTPQPYRPIQLSQYSFLLETGHQSETLVTGGTNRSQLLETTSGKWHRQTMGTIIQNKSNASGYVHRCIRSGMGGPHTWQMGINPNLRHRLPSRYQQNHKPPPHTYSTDRSQHAGTFL